MSRKLLFDAFVLVFLALFIVLWAIIAIRILTFTPSDVVPALTFGPFTIEIATAGGRDARHCDRVRPRVRGAQRDPRVRGDVDRPQGGGRQAARRGRQDRLAARRRGARLLAGRAS